MISAVAHEPEHTPASTHGLVMAARHFRWPGKAPGDPGARNDLRRRIFHHGVILPLFINYFLRRQNAFVKCNSAIAQAPESNNQPMKCPSGAYHKIEIVLMKRTLLFLLAFTSFTIALQASPTPTPGPKRTSSESEKKRGAQETVSQEIAQSANGWFYVKGEWVHSDGYKYVNGKVFRTSARTGRAFPKPPGKLALENAHKLTPKAGPAPDSAEKAAETRRKNLTPTAAPQTGTHL